jgi:hypothetical protein
MERYLTFGLFLFLAFFTIPGLCQERFVMPVDEAAQDTSFVAFRTKLIAAAERKDANFILSILDPKINLSFGGDEGIPAFKRIWKISSKDSPFWKEFLPVIKNGGRWWRGEPGGKREMIFYAPYSFDGWPEDLDSFTYHTIFGSNVNLRKDAKTNAEVITRLSYNVVQIDEDSIDEKTGKSKFPNWWKVKTLGGLTGFVNQEFVRSPIDYRAGFEKKRGQWKMVAFIAGD